MADNENLSNGPKTRDALAALDEAIEKVNAFQEDDDEQDASEIWDRVHALQAKLTGAPSHAPKDALTGLPVDPAAGDNLGPADPLRTADPVVTPDESGVAPEQEPGSPSLSEDRREGES